MLRSIASSTSFLLALTSALCACSSADPGGPETSTNEVSASAPETCFALSTLEGDGEPVGEFCAAPEGNQEQVVLRLGASTVFAGVVARPKTWTFSLPSSDCDTSILDPDTCRERRRTKPATVFVQYALPGGALMFSFPDEGATRPALANEGHVLYRGVRYRYARSDTP